MSAAPDPTWRVTAVCGVVFVVLLVLSHLAGDPVDTPAAAVPSPTPTPTTPPPQAPETQAPRTLETLPGGGRRIFGRDRMLVAYYGTARTGALGVLGETDPDTMVRRLRRAAEPFERPGSSTQIVFELIVTVADAQPGRDGDFNHDIDRREVQRYVDAAHRHGALLLLDLQPGRAGFLSVARRWEWALREPHVGLALDPEWRMGRRGVPGQRIGSVAAEEVDRVSRWLSGLVRRERLPQKLLVLHQFRTDMVEDVERITPRRGLVMVQHVDGFGTPAQKLDTFRTVVRPRQFVLGFKLFYDEDRRLMRPGEVRQIRPRVRFVSYQ